MSCMTAGGQGVRICNPGAARLSLLLLAGEPIGQARCALWPICRFKRWMTTSKAHLGVLA